MKCNLFLLEYIFCLCMKRTLEFLNLENINYEI